MELGCFVYGELFEHGAYSNPGILQIGFNDRKEVSTPATPAMRTSISSARVNNSQIAVDSARESSEEGTYSDLTGSFGTRQHEHFLWRTYLSV
jgi:hypothetical protein